MYPEPSGSRDLQPRASFLPQPGPQLDWYWSVKRERRTNGRGMGSSNVPYNEVPDGLDIVSIVQNNDVAIF